MSGVSPDKVAVGNAFRDAFNALESDIQFHLAALRRAGLGSPILCLVQQNPYLEGLQN